MAEKTENAFLGTEKLGTLMRKYAVPCVISLPVAAMAAINNINGQYNKRPCRGLPGTGRFLEGGVFGVQKSSWKLCKMQKIPILYQIS